MSHAALTALSRAASALSRVPATLTRASHPPSLAPPSCIIACAVPCSLGPCLHATLVYPSGPRSSCPRVASLAPSEPTLPFLHPTLPSLALRHPRATLVHPLLRCPRPASGPRSNCPGVVSIAPSVPAPLARAVCARPAPLPPPLSCPTRPLSCCPDLVRPLAASLAPHLPSLACATLVLRLHHSLAPSGARAVSLASRPPSLTLLVHPLAVSLAPHLPSLARAVSLEFHPPFLARAALLVSHPHSCRPHSSLLSL
ncbi:hypothetical protein DENSPDRAFT_879048 [Dentipellis sp. KUC8613]|nr:hypothetical protein DENSPDRAFT_879048 [Dentipellis sp. KUC8613]